MNQVGVEDGGSHKMGTVDEVNSTNHEPNVILAQNN